MERLCTTGVYSIEGGYNAAQLWQVMCRIHIVDTLRLKQQESCSKNDYIQHDMIWSENDMWNDIMWYYDTTWYDNGYIYLIYKHLTIYIILYIHQLQLPWNHHQVFPALAFHLGLDGTAAAPAARRSGATGCGDPNHAFERLSPRNWWFHGWPWPRVRDVGWVETRREVRNHDLYYALKTNDFVPIKRDC